MGRLCPQSGASPKLRGNGRGRRLGATILLRCRVVTDGIVRDWQKIGHACRGSSTTVLDRRPGSTGSLGQGTRLVATTSTARIQQQQTQTTRHGGKNRPRQTLQIILGPSLFVGTRPLCGRKESQNQNLPGRTGCHATPI